jgi:hypothetical protein
MKSILYAFAGIALVGLIFAAVFFGGFLFDVAGGARVNGFIFQTNAHSAGRIGTPMPLDELTDSFVRDRLIKRFITEYFYVIPDLSNVQARIDNGILARLSSPDVFAEWRQKTAPELAQLAAKKRLRLGQTVKVLVENISKKNPGEVLARSEGDEMVVFPGERGLIGKFARVRLAALRGNTFLGEAAPA